MDKYIAEMLNKLFNNVCRAEKRNRDNIVTCGEKISLLILEPQGFDVYYKRENASIRRLREFCEAHSEEKLETDVDVTYYWNRGYYDVIVITLSTVWD